MVCVRFVVLCNLYSKFEGKFEQIIKKTTFFKKTKISFLARPNTNDTKN